MCLERIFGEELRKLREEKKISQEQLGFECELHRTFISQLERGLKTPSLKTIITLSSALDLKPSHFIQKVEKRLK